MKSSQILDAMKAAVASADPGKNVQVSASVAIDAIAIMEKLSGDIQDQIKKMITEHSHKVRVNELVQKSEDFLNYAELCMLGMFRDGKINHQQLKAFIDQAALVRNATRNLEKQVSVRVVEFGLCECREVR